MRDKRGLGRVELLVLGVLVLLLTLFFAPPSVAIPPEIEAQLQSTKVLRIDSDNKAVIWSLRPSADPDRVDYVVLDLCSQDLESEMADVLRNWIYSGKGALVRLGAGHSSWLSPDGETQAQNVSNNWELAVPAAGPAHPVNTGVRTVWFSSYSGRNERLVMTRGPSMALTPILETEEGHVLVSAQQCGVGRVVWASAQIRHLPIVQNQSRLDQYDNARFAVNLDQWLAGFPVPSSSSAHPSVQTQAENEGVDVIRLKNGDVLHGLIMNDVVAIRTSYADLQFPLRDIARVVLEGAGSNVDSLVLRGGDRLSGVLQVREWDLVLPSGASVTLANEQVQEVNVAARAD